MPFETGVLRDTQGHTALGTDGYPVVLSSTRELTTPGFRVQRELPALLQSKLAGALNTSLRFNIGNALATYGPGPGPIETGGAAELNIRTPMQLALGIAYALQSGYYDAGATTYTEAQARALAHRIVDGTSARWGTGPGKFSLGWQTMLWTSLMVDTCWALGDVPEPVVSRVAAAHQAECTHIATVATSYWLTLDGAEITPGDTKAEESAWMGMALYTGALRWPAHPSAEQWLATAVRLLTASTTAVIDVTSGEVVHGVNLSDVFDGANVWDNGGVRNHGIIHPAYVMAMMENQWQVAMLAGRSGELIPEAALFQAERQYRWLVDVVQPTGQTIYIPGSGRLHFPEGYSSHDPNRIEHAIQADIYAHVLGLDSAASISAETWLGLHLDRLINLQAQSSQGYAYGPTQPGEKSVPRWLGMGAMVATMPKTSIYTGPIPGFGP